MLVIIDLDAPPVAPAPGRPTARRRAALRWRAFLVAALLLLPGGAASPGRGRIAEVASTGGRAVSGSLLTETALFALLPDPDGTDRAEIRAFPLTPGGPAWAVPVTAFRGVLSLGPGGATVVFDPGAEWGVLTVLDARTGRVRWHAPTWAVALVLGDRVAMSVRAEDDLGPDRLSVVDVETGRAVWSATAEVNAMYAAGGYLVTVDSERRGTVRTVTGGRVLVRDRRLDERWDTWEATAAGDLLFLIGESSVSAIRPADLTPLWRSPVRAPRAVSACGALICVFGEGDVSLTALEPGTGTVRWADPRWRTVTADGFVTGRALQSARVDLTTGRVLRDLGRAVLAGDLMLRTDRNQTWVVRLRDGRVAGPLPFFAPAECARTRPYLACPTDGRSVTVWRIEQP